MKKKLYTLLSIAGLLVANACTDLKEEVLDESLSTSLTEKEAADGMIAPVYALLPNIYYHTGYFALQEISTDEAILPYRGGTDWGDNGIYLELHKHTYNSNTANVRNTWNPIVQALSRAVTAINVLSENTDPSSTLYLAEARGMRAFYNWMMLDTYGIAFKKDDPSTTSVVLRGQEATDYIKSELLAVEPQLKSRAEVGSGRLTKAAVWGLLARLHLNAAVYRDRYANTFDFTSEDMDAVVEYCNKVIDSGEYALSNDYFDIFGNDNHDNSELIFAVDQRPDLNGHNRMSYFSLSGDQYPLPEYPSANGTDGPGITSDFYESWVQAYAPEDPTRDPRFYQENMSIYSNSSDTCVADADYKINRGILRGQQYGLLRVNGVFLRCEDGRLKVGPLTNANRNRSDLPVIFTERIDFTPEGSNYSTGYRVEKYEFSRESNSGRNNGMADISIVRLADIYLMRAEAKLRKSNDASGALADVNFVRAARTSTTPPPALKSMDLDILFRERGFEFYWEFLRRTDMIRFNKYEGQWTEKTDSNPQKRIFPIPQTAIDGASNLEGYLVQNPGY
ncbi:RagB/SusD family nutrient uptake outer membrane protein [Marinilongibacter aquaticus]|uniref:RagB/SusD family nutrient uptake outer membrane protein n=1 Tax=Marinilongibacter aquaticus TaxID=2975157 RepID=UPI0021BD4A16|nr:RagB/SusD family nutrient uptake outer membrane protein [Marinilongibacter aquaticus]UBM59032.1 RagB/SusD family nutrient uptake outer membrane protein [Marinilongibacter aquaticus]